jgi:TPP-dependent pyruvate/acetoin dehydrogenase alpha subunit
MNMPPNIRDYFTMLLIRAFETRVETLFAEGLIKGTAHPAIGQEAVAVGICGALADGDYVTSTHRGHGHCIARGGDPARIMAELYGKAGGYSRGRGGSQLMADFDIGFLGSNGITGGGIPLATGVALSAKLRRTGRLAVCFFGDGAANQGTFHESLNLAAIWQLPVVYVCENNRYAMSMSVRDAMAITDIARRADAYGMPGVTVDGNDLPAVRAAAAAAVERARAMQGPTLLECKTYRLSGHSRGDPCCYRTRAEERDERSREPIPRYRDHLMAAGELSAADAMQLEARAARAVEDAIAFAEASPAPDPATLSEGVYA